MDALQDRDLCIVFKKLGRSGPPQQRAQEHPNGFRDLIFSSASS